MIAAIVVNKGIDKRLGKKLKKLLGADFLDSPHFTLAMTHRSVSGKRNNERMEFLGDSILGVVITEALFYRLPDASEGYLSRLRASLVNESVLAEISHELDLGESLRLGSGELKSGGARRSSILADALEALIAAVFLEHDMAKAKSFVLQLFATRLAALPTEDELKDPKSRLQEYLQSRGHALPVYQLISTTGDAHRQTFTTECRIDSLQIVTQGVSTSRRKAEQLSADKAFQQVTSK
ncbi:MAG: ribonuclease III [Proteobacteria bacterium]|nr:MAG: ribonuclease III [Pseudomonadota bacterium]